MTRFLMVLMVALCLCAMPALAQDESAMQPEGVVVVQGKVLGGDVGYLKRGKRLLLPIVEVARAAGHKIALDSAKKVAILDGKTHVPVTVVDGRAYAFWSDLQPALAPLKMGLGPAKVVLFIPDPELVPIPGHK